MLRHELIPGARRLTSVKIPVAILMVALAGLCGSCLSPGPVRGPSSSSGSDIRVGMTEDAVVERLGEPVLVDPYQAGKYIFFYPGAGSSDCIGDPDGCTPVVFQDGRVIGIGHPWLSRDRKPPAFAEDGEARAPAPDPDPAPALDAETRREIERLERQVRQIPAARTVDNLRIYRYLLKLDPDNHRYRQKVARYEAQFRREKEQRESLRRERQERRKRQNRVLQRFEGTDRLRLAVENQGNGRFYVWIEYSGNEPIAVAPEHFTLVGRDGRRHACYRCRDIEALIEAGGRAEGRISFDTYAEPGALIFAHPQAGTVRRNFPDR